MKRILTLSLALLPALALAHGGEAAHGHDLLSGFMHPFSGLDHLAAMLAVGLWSGLTLRRAWLAPLVFLALLLLGALSGLSGPAVEPMIAVSVLLLGLLAAARQALAPLLSAALVGAFALFHGMAHGAELNGGAALCGMLLATGLLHLAGLALGLRLRMQSLLWSRLLGGAIALLGLGLLSGMVASA
jgi:urease accessory protein